MRSHSAQCERTPKSKTTTPQQLSQSKPQKNCKCERSFALAHVPQLQSASGRGVQRAGLQREFSQNPSAAAGIFDRFGAAFQSTYGGIGGGDGLGAKGVGG
jgi:hypothetical protein